MFGLRFLDPFVQQLTFTPGFVLLKDTKQLAPLFYVQQIGQIDYIGKGADRGGRRNRHSENNDTQNIGVWTIIVKLLTKSLTIQGSGCNT